MENSVLFDLDGTLTDPKIGITKSVKFALEKFDINVLSLDELEKFIGPPLKESFKEYFDFTEEKTNIAVDYYRDYFTRKGKFENTVYPGIPELLQALKNRNYTLVVATSKPTVFAEEILDYFDISKFFIKIVGSNLDNSRTDKKDIIKYIIEELNLEKNRTVMIGDRKFDIIGSKENGIMSIGVLYGYGTEEELLIEKPNFIVRDVIELEEVIFEKIFS